MRLIFTTKGKTLPVSTLQAYNDKKHVKLSSLFQILKEKHNFV